jgi:O-antigen/teichoic acid export membrane protein
MRLVKIIVAAVGLGAAYLALSNLIVLVFFVPLYFWLFRKIEFSKFDWDLAKEYFNISFPIILIGIFSSLNQYIDKIFLQYASNTNEVGYYSVGFTFSRPVLLLGTAVSAMFFPMFSKLFSENKTNQIKELVVKFDRFLFLFVFPFIILFMIYSPIFVPLILGEKYINSIKVVSLISLSMFIYILQLPYGNMIFGLGKFKQAAMIQFMNLILLIFFLVILVSEKFYYLGATGNAIAILLSNITLFVMTFGTMKKYMKNLKFFYDRKITMAYIVIFGFLYLLYKFLSLNQLNFLLHVYPFFFIFFVFGLMTLMNLITKKDWKQFFSLFKIKDLV